MGSNCRIWKTCNVPMIIAYPICVPLSCISPGGRSFPLVAGLPLFSCDTSLFGVEPESLSYLKDTHSSLSSSSDITLPLHRGCVTSTKTRTRINPPHFSVCGCFCTCPTVSHRLCNCGGHELYRYSMHLNLKRSKGEVKFMDLTNSIIPL